MTYPTRECGWYVVDVCETVSVYASSVLPGNMLPPLHRALNCK